MLYQFFGILPYPAGISYLADVNTDFHLIYLTNLPSTTQPNDGKIYDMYKLPKNFWPLFWSTDASKINIKRDKCYIIHQLLNYGDLRAIKWLIRTYSVKTIKEIFLHHPSKNYYPEVYYFVKNILLGLEKKDLNECYYVINTPRIIR